LSPPALFPAPLLLQLQSRRHLKSVRPAAFPLVPHVVNTAPLLPIFSLGKPRLLPIKGKRSIYISTSLLPFFKCHSYLSGTEMWWVHQYSQWNFIPCDTSLHPRGRQHSFGEFWRNPWAASNPQPQGGTGNITCLQLLHWRILLQQSHYSALLPSSRYCW
jgi:hypothetical protein